MPKPSKATAATPRIIWFALGLILPAVANATIKSAKPQTNVPKNPTMKLRPKPGDSRHPDNMMGPPTTLQKMYGFGFRAFMIIA